MKIKRILMVAICCTCIEVSVYAAPPIPVQAQGAMQAGSINAQNYNNLKDLNRRKHQYEDIKKIEQGKLEVNDTNKDESKNVKRKKDKVEKATVEEYATKGVYVENIEVAPSQILTEKEIKDIIDEYTFQNLTMQDIRSIVDKINKLYMEKGYVTARAYLPQQTVENGNIRIELVEGRVGDITVVNNRWTKDKYIKDRISAKRGKLFDIVKLENDVLDFNRYTDGVELSANLKPGEKRIETTDIEFAAREQSPFHASFIFDNAGRSTIGKQRGGIILQDDSLFGYRDRLTIGAYASRHSNTPFADYSIPVNKKDGRVGFMFSSSYSQIANGNYQMFNIRSRSYTYSLYFNQPLIRKPYMELSSLSSLNYKQATTSFDGHDLYTDKITAAETGLNLRYDTKKGIWYLNQSVYYAFPIFQPESNYLKLEGGFVRLHDFSHGIIGQFRGNYQVIPKDVVPYIDQFQAGGLSSVRGYSEGLLIGRSGYLLSAEVLFPLLPSKVKSRDKQKEIPFIGKYIKGVVFIDQATVFPFKGSGPGADGYNANDMLLSVGAGLRITLPGSMVARLYWGFPCIRNSHEEFQPNGARFHFDITFSPDFDKLLANRHPKEPKNKIEKVQKQENIKPVKAKKVKVKTNKKEIPETPLVEKKSTPVQVETKEVKTIETTSKPKKKQSNRKDPNTRTILKSLPR